VAGVFSTARLRRTGKTEGEAEARGLDVTDAERERITGSTNLKQLKN
jgi:hypothetical protein